MLTLKGASLRCKTLESKKGFFFRNTFMLPVTFRTIK